MGKVRGRLGGVPLQNRVTPLGQLLDTPERGLVYGNRGCLHDAVGRIRRPYAVRRWISCRLEFRGRRRTPLLQPGRFTELFFLDEATAFAAGHRPCAECRRGDYDRFSALWRQLHPEDRGADAIDLTLHGERWREGRQRRHRTAYGELPNGSFVLRDSAPWLVQGAALVRWTPGGYTEAVRRPVRETATVLTPPTLRAVLASGWDAEIPLLHPTAPS